MRVNSKEQFMLGQPMLLKTGKKRTGIVCSCHSLKRKNCCKRACLYPIPGGGVFFVVVFRGKGLCGGFVCLLLNLPQERQTLDNNLEAILQGSTFVCAKSFGMLMWYAGIDCTGKRRLTGATWKHYIQIKRIK